MKIVITKVISKTENEAVYCAECRMEHGQLMLLFGLNKIDHSREYERLIIAIELGWCTEKTSIDREEVMDYVDNSIAGADFVKRVIEGHACWGRRPNHERINGIAYRD